MSHWIVIPVVLPALLAAVLTLAMRHHASLQRVFSVAGCVALLAVALWLLAHAATGDYDRARKVLEPIISSTSAPRMVRDYAIKIDEVYRLQSSATAVPATTEQK